MSKKPSTYDKVDRLTDYMWARLRTETNFGNREIAEETIVGYDGKSLLPRQITFVPALATYFREIIDNALDESQKCKNAKMKGFGDRLDVTYDEPTMTFTVEDNGRGIPTSLVEMVFTEARTGRNFRDRDEVAGTNGVGAATTNFTSEYFTVDSWHDNVHHHQEFKESPFGAEEQIIAKAAVSKCPASKHGTRVEFRPSKEVYPNMLLPDNDFVKCRMYEVASNNPDMKISYNGERLAVPKSKSNTLFGLEAITISIDVETDIKVEKHRSLSGSESNKKGRFLSTFSLVPNVFTASDDIVHSIVNNICAYNGGTHVSAFKSVFYNNFLDALKPEARKRKLDKVLDKKDIASGLLIYNNTKMVAPNFDSQSKNKLTNTDVRKYIDKGMDDINFKTIVRNNPAWVEAILDRCAERTQKRDWDDATKKSKKNLRVKVAKLKDATGSDRKKCILIIGEGDSAVGGAMNARDARVHGGLPLRGKIMNIHNESFMNIMKSEPLADIMNAMGLKLGDRATRASLRYGKIFIATDEDEDGKNIFSLLVNFLFTFWPELFDKDLDPFVFKLETPFVILKKGKTKNYFYGRDYDKFDPEDWKGWEISRAKGLGRLEQSDWKNILGNPPVTPIVDTDKDLKEALDLVFNPSRPDDRKDWLNMQK